MSDDLTKPPPQEGIILPDGPSGVEGFTMAAGLKGDQAAASLEYEQDIGKPGGWSLGAGWQWAKQQGHAAMGWVSWRPKK